MGMDPQICVVLPKPHIFKDLPFNLSPTDLECFQTLFHGTRPSVSRGPYSSHSSHWVILSLPQPTSSSSRISRLTAVLCLARDVLTDTLEVRAPTLSARSAPSCSP